MKGKTIGYYKNIQNVPYCVADVDLKVGMGVTLDRAGKKAKLPADDSEAKACIYVVTNIDDRPETRRYEDTLVVHRGDYVRADDMTTLGNLEVELADWEVSTDYGTVAKGDKLVMGTDGLWAKAEGGTDDYKVYLEVLEKTAYMGKGLLAVVHVN